VAGRPGPVVLALPEDTLFREAAVADVPSTTSFALSVPARWTS
jgi:thiamine pyrophosphate-dependent acetolactate synthase large subunit-like protein